MINVAIYTPIYNDAEALAKSAEKCKDLGYDRIVIDGRYDGFKQINNSDFSTDDLSTVCDVYGFDLIRCSPCMEQEKFNFACNYLKNRGYDAMILLSSDEWLTMMKPVFTTWFETLCGGCDYPVSISVQIDELRPNHKYDQKQNFLPKIFYNVGKIENRHNHWATYIKGTDKLLRMFPTSAPTVVLHHDHMLRSEERDDLMLEYQDKNIQFESSNNLKVSRDRFYGF